MIWNIAKSLSMARSRLLNVSHWTVPRFREWRVEDNDPQLPLEFGHARNRNTMIPIEQTDRHVVW